jgi:hypothetical protein
MHRPPDGSGRIEADRADGFAKGIDVRNSLFGEERKQQPFATSDPLAQEFQTPITRSGFGSRVSGDRSRLTPTGIGKRAARRSLIHQIPARRRRALSAKRFCLY